MRVFLAFLLLALPCVLGFAVPWSNCGVDSTSDVLQLSSVEATAWPLYSNADVQLTLSGKLSRDIMDGDYTYTLSHNDLVVAQHTVPLSDSLNLPLSIGRVDIAQSMHVPKDMVGAFKLNIKARTGDNQQIACMNVNFNVLSSSSSMESELTNIMLSAHESASAPAAPAAASSAAAADDNEVEYPAEDPENAYWNNDDDSAEVQYVDDLSSLDNDNDEDGDDAVYEAGLDADENDEEVEVEGDIELSDILVFDDAQDDAQVTDVPVPITNCGSGKDTIIVNSITASSWPPTSGANLTVTLNATNNAVVTGGSYNVVVNFDGFPVVNQQGDLAKVLPLPIQTGNFVKSGSVAVPSSVPSGSIAINLSANDLNGDELFCFALTWDM